MRRWQDTPPRYMWHGQWGLTAISALHIIALCRRRTKDRRMADQLEEERQIFVAALKRENSTSSIVQPYQAKLPDFTE